MAETVTATGYVVLEGVRSRYGKQEVREGKVRRVTAGRPTLHTDEIAVKLSIQVPVAAFGPFQASAVIEVPEDLIAANNVEVVAEPV
jgi:hypothetical protein